MPAASGTLLSEPPLGVGITASAQLRIARPTANITDLLPFYCEGLGFEIVSSFTDHEGFDGVMLALPSSGGGGSRGASSYHLEFTSMTANVAVAGGHQQQQQQQQQNQKQAIGHQLRAPSQENLLVFYLPDIAQYESAVERMQRLGHAPVASFNPYWDRCGKTFEDPDGYRIVLANSDWTPEV